MASVMALSIAQGLLPLLFGLSLINAESLESLFSPSGTPQRLRESVLPLDRLLFVRDH